MGDNALGLEEAETRVVQQVQGCTQVAADSALELCTFLARPRALRSMPKHAGGRSRCDRESRGWRASLRRGPRRARLPPWPTRRARGPRRSLVGPPPRADVGSSRACAMSASHLRAPGVPAACRRRPPPPVTGWRGNECERDKVRGS